MLCHATLHPCHCVLRFTVCSCYANFVACAILSAQCLSLDLHCALEWRDFGRSSQRNFRGELASYGDLESQHARSQFTTSRITSQPTRSHHNHTASHHITSHHITSHHITPHPTTYYVISRRNQPHRITTNTSCHYHQHTTETQPATTKTPPPDGKAEGLSAHSGSAPR